MKKVKDENTIYDPLPIEVAENLAELREDLDQKVPFKELDRNLLIATWNIRGFGNFTRKWMSDEKDSRATTSVWPICLIRAGCSCRDSPVKS